MSKVLILDGAMGTMLQKSGLKLGKRPELLNITNKSLITGIHKEYIKAGAKIIYTNTFGANELKLKNTGYDVEEIVSEGVKAGLDAVSGTDTLVALDIGPLGELLEPAGSLSFERAYDCFKRVAVCGEKSGANLIVVETMTDLYEVKAAVLAVKENTKLPILVSMTFEKSGRTFTGCSIEAMATLLEGLNVDAVGINCSLGPDEIYPLAEKLAKSTSLPIFVKPNAGLPDPKTGKYHISPEEFTNSLVRYAKLGVSMVGGCCGTTPEYISCLSKAFSNVDVAKRSYKKKSLVSTNTKVVEVNKVRIIGERINPTGKKLMREALINGDMGYILKQAVTQQTAGADILDVNVGAPGVDEPSVLPKVVKAIQSVSDLPLQLDSSNAVALENGLRVYNGKAIVNSVNGTTEVLDKILPIVKKYGASVVGLTLDEKGIPQTAEDRLKIATKILKYCNKYNISKEDVYIDCLTLTASAQQEGAKETLRAVELVKNTLQVKTVLGVSNISFGLPNRELLNQSFLLMALTKGLDLPIMNPNNEGMIGTISAFNVLNNEDKQAFKYIDRYKDYQKAVETKVVVTKSETSNFPPLIEAIKNGLKDDVTRLTKEMLLTVAPMDVVNNYLIPALDIVGEQFEKGKLFLPQLLQSAVSAQGAFDEVKKLLSKSDNKVTKGPIILATVKGDIHDIGKNIVKVILENYGFSVIDLGRDVDKKEVVKSVKSSGAKLVGLSALMTTTLESMKDTIKEIKDNFDDVKVMVGGAVLTRDYAFEIGADYYSKDAKEAVDIAKLVFN